MLTQYLSHKNLSPDDLLNLSELQVSIFYKEFGIWRLKTLREREKEYIAQLSDTQVAIAFLEHQYRWDMSPATTELFV
jgi:hypothetical protein